MRTGTNLLMRQINTLNPTAQLPFLPRSVSADGRGMGEWVEISPYLIARSITQANWTIKGIEGYDSISSGCANERQQFRRI